MANKWKDVRKSLSSEQEVRIKARVKAEVAKMPLAEVRRAREMTQVRLAEVLRVNQGAVSKMEQRSDMYLSTLRSYVEAMGGRLDIRAVFPNGEIMLESLGETLAGPRKVSAPVVIPRTSARSGKIARENILATSR